MSEPLRDAGFRQDLTVRLAEARARTDELISLLRPDALYDRPIPERHRNIFYLGHFEAFDWNLVCRGAFGSEPFHDSFDQLFAFGIDPVGGDLPADNYDLRADWSVSRFNPTHTLGSTVNAQLPLGIFLTGTMSTNSGQRYNITTGTDDNQDGRLTDRPAGFLRNTGDAPKFLSFGFNISKAYFFERAGGAGGTRTNLNVFANITNAFNNVNFNLPSGVMTSPNFGLSTSAQDPRLIEIGLRFQF